jgi:hypothetical protein
MKNKIISVKFLLVATAISFLINNQSIAQCPGGVPPWCTGGNSVTGFEKLGGDNTSIAPLEIHMDGPYSIDFYTNNIAGTPPTPIKHMELTMDGDLNILNWSTTLTKQNSYQIGGDKVLWHNGTTSNIFVGVNAGNTNLKFKI